MGRKLGRRDLFAALTFRRRRAAFALAAAIALTLGPYAALADTTADIEAGRSAGRGVLVLSDPRACGIALLHARCVADVDAFLHGRGDGDFARVPNVGAHPASGLRAFVATGDRNAFDTALAWINNTAALPAQWSADPGAAARYDAGVVDVMMASAGANETLQTLAAASAVDLWVHAAVLPPGTLPVDAAGLHTPGETRPNAIRMLPFVRDLVRALRTSAPPPPLAPVSVSSSPAGDAALGLDLATMSELLESPRWLFQNDAQTFATALAARFDDIVPSPGRPFVATFRTKVRPDTSADPPGAARALASALGVVSAAGAPERAQRIALGSAAGQLAYNAALLRSPDAARSFLTVLANADLLDAAVPGWADARTTGKTIAADDWLAQHAFALRLVDLIEKANGT